MSEEKGELVSSRYGYEDLDKLYGDMERAQVEYPITPLYCLDKGLREIARQQSFLTSLARE